MNDVVTSVSQALANAAGDIALALLIARLLIGMDSPLIRPRRLLVLLVLALASSLAGSTQAMADESLSLAQNLWLVLSATHTGAMMQLAGVGVLLVAAGIHRAGRPGPFAWLGAALLIYARADTGHAAELPLLSVGIVIHAIHLTAAGAWVGTVLAGAVAWRRHATAANARRLSYIATAALAVVLLTGVLNIERMNAAHDILHGWSGYDSWLAAKLGLAAAALLLGLYNRQRYLPRLSGADPVALAGFGRVLRIEAGILVLTLLAAACLASTFPGIRP
jgi:copper resistance protein D